MKIEMQILKAWKRAVPLVAVDTKDQVCFFNSLVGTVNSEINAVTESLDRKLAIVSWDCASGVTYPEADVLSGAAVKGLGASSGLRDLGAFLEAARLTDHQNSLYVIHNMQFFIDNPLVIQHILNIRDVFKAQAKTLVMLGVGIKLPVELENDVIAFDEPLPDQSAMERIIGSVVRDANLSCNDADVSEAARATIGVTAFASENIAAMAIDRAANNINIAELWRSKTKKINSTPGLSVASAGSFDSIGGVSVAKRFFTDVLNGRRSPNAIVWVDEIEKAMGGSGTDTSGVSQDQLMQLLTWMQEKNASGAILNGPPGAAKSAFAKACGAHHDVPTIQLDLGGMKAKHVGDSEKMIRDALKVIDAVSEGKTLWLATCNSMHTLPPELRRRFKLGVWFFDLPDIDERRAIWSIYLNKYAMASDDAASLIGNEWTGAEIETCCDLAYQLNIPLTEAAGYVVPVMQHSADVIEELRKGASGRYLSASRPGPYQMPQTVLTKRPTRRSISE